MACSPAPQSSLNPNAIPFTPFSAPHDSQMIPHHFPLHFHAQFPNPLPYKNPNFILFPDTHHPFPYSGEELNTGHWVRPPEQNPGGFSWRKHRNRGIRQGNYTLGRNELNQPSGRQNHGRKTNPIIGAVNRRCNFTTAHRRRKKFNKNPRKETEQSIPLKSGGGETTVMIRNIPNKYTRKLMENFLTKHCNSENRKGVFESSFDFLYLPIDFKTKWNKGYAFVNFTTPVAARSFLVAENEERWELFNSSKIRDICCAKIQGKVELIRRFEGMEFPSEDFQPLCFVPARDGSPGQEVKEIPIGFCIKANMT